MGKAKKLPSGNYRVREYDFTDDSGKKHYRSFTANTKAKAEFMAKEFKADKKIKKHTTEEPVLKLKDAYAKYIALKEPILSPSTIREYERQKNKSLQILMDKNVYAITQEEVQKAINTEIEKGISPKTVRNIHGLLSAVMKRFRPDFALNSTFPQKIKNKLQIPTKEEIKKILEYVKGSDMELPLILCSSLGLRRSELCALNWEDINFKDKTLNIEKAIVQNKLGEWVIKPPKSHAGYRTLEIPDFIFEVLLQHKGKKGKITDLTPTALYCRYKKILEKLELPNYRLHDLRHYTASVMLALNIPNKYAMEIMGHETDNMLKNVYQHTMREEMKKYTVKINNFYNEK